MAKNKFMKDNPMINALPDQYEYLSHLNKILHKNKMF